MKVVRPICCGLDVHKRLIVATIARMMLVCIWHMLTNGETFNPSDYDELKNPRPGPEALTEESALRFLESRGYDISKIVAGA